MAASSCGSTQRTLVIQRCSSAFRAATIGVWGDEQSHEWPARPMAPRQMQSGAPARRIYHRRLISRVRRRKCRWKTDASAPRYGWRSASTALCIGEQRYGYKVRCRWMRQLQIFCRQRLGVTILALNSSEKKAPVFHTSRTRRCQWGSDVDRDQHRAFVVNTQKAGTRMAGRARAGHGSRDFRQCLAAHRSVSSQSTHSVG